MNAQRKKAALKKVETAVEGGATAEEAIELLKTDTANYTEEELSEINTAFNTGSSGTAKSGLLNLEEFNYKDLTGSSFKKYVELTGDRSFVEVDKETGEEKGVVGSLELNKQYDFQLHKVEVVRKKRYVGVDGSPMDFNGLKVKNDKPETFSRMPLYVALDLNSQILNAHSIAGHGKYWFLRKD